MGGLILNGAVCVPTSVARCQVLDISSSGSPSNRSNRVCFVFLVQGTAGFDFKLIKDEAIAKEVKEAGEKASQAALPTIDEHGDQTTKTFPPLANHPGTANPACAFQRTHAGARSVLRCWRRRPGAGARRCPGRCRRRRGRQDGAAVLPACEVSHRKQICGRLTDERRRHGHGHGHGI